MTGEEIQARLAALSAEIEHLRAQLDEARATFDLTMRGQGRCRACGGQSILHADSLLDRTYGAYAPLAVAVKSKWTGSGKGEIEAYICAGCGLMELYVKKPGDLEPDGKVITRAGEQAGGEPYR
jgi:hypothetical protein